MVRVFENVRTWKPASVGLLALLMAGCGGSAAPASSAAAAVSAPAVSAAAKPASQAAQAPSAAASAAPVTSTSASAAPASAAAGNLTPVRWGELSPSVSDSGMLIAQAKGFFQEQRIRIESQPFDTALNMIPPLSTNQLDAGGGAIGAALFNAVNRDIPVVIAADKGSALPGGGYQGLVIRKDLSASGKVKAIGDLKGLKIGSAAPGGVGEYDLMRLLKKGGLTIKDVDLVQLAFPNMAAALTNKSIDAALIIEPFLTDFIHKDIAVLYQRSGEWAPEEQIAVILFGPDFAKNTDAANRFMTAYVKGLRYYNDAFVKKDPKTRSDVIDILAARTTLKDKSLFDEVGMPGLDADGKVNLADLKAQQDYYLSTGAQPKPVDLDKVVKNDFTAAAVKQLGPYK